MNILKEFIIAFYEVYIEICTIGGFFLLTAIICLLILNKLERIEQKKRLDEIKLRKKHKKILEKFRNGEEC